jgi:tetratricopeptide (TPR) repeat protein
MRMIAVALLSVSLAAPQAAPLGAQNTAQVSLVLPHGDGRLIVPSGPAWVPVSYKLEDSGSRLTFTFADHLREVTLEASVFPNDDGSADACRELTLTLLLANLHSQGAIKDERKGVRTLSGGLTLATESFLIATTGVNPGSQQNVYAFAAGPHTCAELHLTQAGSTPASDPLFQNEIDHLRFEPDYGPTWQDFNTIASSFYDTMRDFRAAAVFYRRALETLPSSPATLNQRRTMTDQLAMSYAIYGDVKNSYNVNEDAILQDPTYPYYYYNLACVDAELHNPLDARRHLELAFARRGNALPGEPLPNPLTDTSIQKLQSNRVFWLWLKSFIAKNQ